MATGTFSGGIYGYHYRLRVDWSSEPVVSGNYSKCVFDYYLEQDQYYDLAIGARTNSISVDGAQTEWSSGAVSNGGNVTTYLGSSKINIYHSADGTKTAKIKAVFNIGATLNGVYYGSIEASSDIELDKIHRTSTAQLKNPFTIGEKVDISIIKENESFRHKLLAVIGNVETEIANGVNDSYEWDTGTWAEGNFWVHASTGLSSVYGSVRVQTFLDGVYIGYKDVSFTAKVPEEYNGESIYPSVECSLSADNSASFPESIKNVLVKSRSKLKVDFTGSFYNSSIGIGEYSVQVDGMQKFSSKEPVFSSNEFINVSGESINVVCSLTDKSGRKVDISKTISVMDYTTPVVTINSCDRAIYNEDSGEFEKNRLGERIVIVAGLVPKTGYTAEKISLHYEVSGGGVVIANGELYSGVACVPEISFSRSEPYSVKVWASDVFGDGPSVSAPVSVAEPVFHAPKGGNGFALGMFSKSDGIFRSAYPMNGVITKKIETVNFLGANLKAVFTRFGNVTSLTLSGRFDESPNSTGTGATTITIPSGFEADEDQVTGENTVFPLIARGSHVTEDVGSVMISEKNQIRIFYSVSFAKDWTIGASLFWFNEDVKKE